MIRPKDCATTRFAFLAAVAVHACLQMQFFAPALQAAETHYLVGCGSADITGPAAGFPIDGYVKQDHYTQGIHLRQRARAFLIAEPSNGRRVVIVCAELSKINAELYQVVLQRLQQQFGDLYTRENVIVSATHTHSGAGGLWRYAADGPLGTGFFHEYLDAVAEGIVAAIVGAHGQLQPGRIFVARGNVKNASANRSSVAYRNNPQEERARYDTEVDQEMTLLKFVGGKSGEQELGTLNWFAVHPTSMTFNSSLLSGDSKGYASLQFERHKNNTLVAAFAQTNCGDVTGNLNLNNTGPGKNDSESTRIIGQRQLDVAYELYNNAIDELSGPIEVRQTHVDFSQLTVADEFTKAGQQTTSAAAYGYAFAAGSTEDGGGHPLFQEGMKERNPAIDLLSAQMFPNYQPDGQLRDLQRPKAILFAPGVANSPTGMSQVLPLTICRIGQLALIVGPAEFTTMSGRRLRHSMQEVFGDEAKYVVIAGYSNDYGGYVATREEYEMQHYEGGHTLFGPWTLAGYQQEYVRLARAMVNRAPAKQGADLERDWPHVKRRSIQLGADVEPKDATFGDVVVQPQQTCAKGEQVVAAFWTGQPRNNFRTGGNYLTIELQTGDGWTTVATDGDWETRCRWQPHREAAQPCQIRITWDIPKDAKSGMYRIVHHGHYRLKADSEGQTFETVSNVFRVQ